MIFWIILTFQLYYYDKEVKKSLMNEFKFILYDMFQCSPYILLNFIYHYNLNDSSSKLKNYNNIIKNYNKSIYIFNFYIYPLNTKIFP